FRDFHDLQRYFRRIYCRCLSFFPWLRAHDRFGMKYLNRSCCALSETARGGHQLIETYFALHLYPRRLTNRAKHRCWWATLPLRNTHAHLRTLEIFSVSSRNIFLHFLFRAASRTNRTLKERQRTNIALAIHFRNRVQIRLSKHAYIDQVARSEQVVPDSLVVYGANLIWPLK